MKCGACCIAPSISSAIPGMPKGKPPGQPCVHLDKEFRCGIFHHPERPGVCARLQPSRDMCGRGRDEALRYLENLELLTAP
ncbi:zinc/iron-chelating domain-containing protein [Leminorella grimontii]|nr:zinc/iron-chelating domain-containing protein [Leminorella grimontii]